MSLAIKLRPAEPMHLQIERQVQRQILTGALAPAQRLPTTRSLAAEWRVDCKTVQRAMQRLRGAGLIERNPKRGTYVRATRVRPLIGIVVGPNLFRADAYFYRALVVAIQEELARRQWDHRVYDNLSCRAKDEKEALHRHILADIRNHTYKGLLWIDAPADRFKQEVLTRDLPKVFFADDANVLDMYGFARAAVAYLAGHGRGRLFCIRGAVAPKRVKDDADGFRDGCAAHGLDAARGSICQLTHLGETMTPLADWLGYRRIAALLKTWQETGTRPDGVIVSDDVIMRGVAVGLREHGVKVPEEMLVVAATKAEIRHLYAVPVARYEFSVGEIARQLVDRLWRLVVKEPLPRPPAPVQGHFADEKAETSINGFESQPVHP